MRPSASSLFVVLGVVLAASLGVYARSASGGGDESAAPLPLPSDAARFGFEVRGRTGGDVALLEATRAFEVALGNGPLRGRPPEATAARRAAQVLSRELGRYGRPFLRRVHLAGVVLASGLTEGDTPIPSLPNVGGLLLLDVDASEVDLVRAVHHEVFHFFDLADDGRLAPDPGWAALSPKGLAYGSGGRTLRGAWAARASEDLPGFVTAYATSAVEEDKAETFSFAVARPGELAPRLPRDAALAAKRAEIARRVAAFDGSAARSLGLLTE